MCCKLYQIKFWSGSVRGVSVMAVTADYHPKFWFGQGYRVMADIKSKNDASNCHVMGVTATKKRHAVSV